MSNMFSFEAHRDRSSITGLLKAAGHTLEVFVEMIFHGQKLRDEYLKLMAMADPELQDMGISRSDISAVVAGAYPWAGRLTLVAQERMPEDWSQFRQDNNRSRSKENIMCQASEETTFNEIDVRSLVPAKRHEKIFQLVGELTAGESFILVNDHDPKPLYYQLEAEYPSQFSWTYIEKGPAVWRVEIGRLQKAA